MEKYRIIVSEPWNFESPSGNNIITGIILKRLSSTCVIFRSDYLLNFDGQLGQLLILKYRYEKQNSNQNNVYDGTIGGGLILTNDYERRDDLSLEYNSKYVLIGRLEKVK